MIERKSFTKEWVESFRQKAEYAKTDPAIIEKMIYALALLEQIALHKLNFVFKGGTSLILLLENTNRFSIDIDISTQHSSTELESVFKEIVAKSVFEHFGLDAKRSRTGKFSKAHYKFFYQSNFSTSSINRAANYVLLDIVFEKANYPKLELVPIQTKWLVTEAPHLTVKTPTINSILGDKLTAFAPNTNGVPFNRRKETEILKQLFDVAFLVGEISDIYEVNKSFLNTAQKEIGYRNLEIESNSILDDIFSTGIMISMREKNKGEDQNKFEEIKRGIKGLKNVVAANNFTFEHAIEAAAKSAWFAMKLKNENLSPFELFDTNMDLPNLQIEKPEYKFLNKLKKTIKPAFYYWYHCLHEINQLK